MRWLTLFIRSNLLIALASVFFYWSGFMLLDISFHFPTGFRAFLIFISTLLIYHLPSMTKVIDNPRSHPRHLIFYILSLTCIVYFSFQVTIYEFLYLLHLGFIGFLYNYPFNKPDIRQLPVRVIPLLKIFVIGYVWSSIGSVYIFFHESLSISWQEILDIWIIQFLFILSIALPFDIRDFSEDKEKNLKTIPGIIGIKKTKILAYSMTAIFVLTAGLTLSYWITFIITGAVVMLAVGYSNERKPEFYFTGIIDGLIILYALIIYLTLK